MVRSSGFRPPVGHGDIKARFRPVRRTDASTEEIDGDRRIDEVVGDGGEAPIVDIEHHNTETPNGKVHMMETSVSKLGLTALASSPEVAKTLLGAPSVDARPSGSLGVLVPEALEEYPQFPTRPHPKRPNGRKHNGRPSKRSRQ